MKILFLDIDGVVNCAKTMQRHRGFIGIDPYMALLVGRIVEATGCKVVLSSSWRKSKDGRDEVERQVYKLYDYTGGSATGIRGEEIKTWMEDFQNEGCLIERYAILDDDSDMLPEQMPNFFKTTWAEGLNEEIANRVITHLGRIEL